LSYVPQQLDCGPAKPFSRRSAEFRRFSNSHETPDEHRLLGNHCITFTSDFAGTVKLDFEIESYNPATGAIVAWVRIPALSHTCDTVI